MNKKPSLIDKSTEELLNEINIENYGNEEIQNLEESSAFLFLCNFNIRTGNFPIKKSLLFSLYKKTLLSPITLQSFHSEVSNYIKNDYRYYYINEELKSLISNLSFKIAEIKSKRNQISPKDIKRFERFLLEMNIKIGKGIYIEAKALYYFFDRWTYQNKLRTHNFNKFNKLVNAYLDNPINLTANPSYGIDRKFYEKVSKEEIKKAQEWAKKFKSTKQN